MEQCLINEMFETREPKMQLIICVMGRGKWTPGQMLQTISLDDQNNIPHTAYQSFVLCM